MSETKDDLDWLRNVQSPREHAFWGADPSGYCGCDDCEAPDE